MLPSFLFFIFRNHLHAIACDKWSMASDEIRSKMATMAAAAAWGLCKILYTNVLPLKMLIAIAAEDILMLLLLLLLHFTK